MQFTLLEGMTKGNKRVTHKWQKFLNSGGHLTKKCKVCGYMTRPHIEKRFGLPECTKPTDEEAGKEGV